MSDPVTARPAICLNMIVRNEAHVVREALDSAAPYISSWVIVDTGSEDGTQDLVRNHMARLGIPGELYERPWRDFGYNRTEALSLAQGHGDYIWVMDADDMIAGTPDFTGLNADIYFLRLRDGDQVYWYPQLFRDGTQVHYQGVTHESPQWDDTRVVAHLEGDYHIADRHLSARNLDPQKYALDRDLLLAEVERNPEDARSVFFLAQSYFCLGDFANARTWYERRVEMGGFEEQIYYAMYQIALVLANLGAPWPDVQDAFLQAWAFRPTRAEPLYEIARRYRQDRRFQLGYRFAKLAAEIPFPEQDILLVRADVYAWRAIDEQAVCASWIDKQQEAFELCRRVLAQPGIPDEDRARITGNRDVCVATMLEAASSYPATLVQSLLTRSGEAEVAVSLVAGPDRASAEQTLNSLVHCCLDASRVGRFLVLDAGLSTPDRAMLQERYGFLEFVAAEPANSNPLAHLREHIDARFWLHLGEGWRFFAPEHYITRLKAVLEAEAQVFQVGVNFTDAVKLTRAIPQEQQVRRTPDAGHYVLTDLAASGPAMFDTARLDRAGGLLDTDPDPIAGLQQRAAAAGLRTASLDEVLCVARHTIAGSDLAAAGPQATRPAVCLNMIVRNEAHIIHEALDSVAPFISSWVIVDTGSDDGTQNVIRTHMARLGIPGKLHERPWRNFAHNRTEALTLAQGQGDYIWILDADDTLDGTPDFTGLKGDIYMLRYRLASDVYWRPQLFRDGLRMRYEGVVHEYASWDEPYVCEQLEGDYHIEARTVGARSQDPLKYAHDRDLLLGEIERNPEDARSVFYLAQSSFDLGRTRGHLYDFVNAHKWYERRVEMGGWEEEVFFSMLRVAESMTALGAPWPDVQDAFLKAWEFRPSRAEPLHAIACRYREDQRFDLGYLFAERAAEIPFPQEDSLFVRADIYAWRATDEQAVCASWIGKQDEAFELCRRILARPDVPDEERPRITGNRDVCVATMLDAACSYPDALVQELPVAARDAQVVVSLVSGPDRASTEQTLNSFVHCCRDISRVGRFLVLDTGLSTPDRAMLQERYRFLEFVVSGADDALADLREHVSTRFWLHLGQGWRFFASENFITRLTAVLKAETQVYQVSINFADATTLTGSCAPETAVQRTPEAGRYVLTDAMASGPAMFDTTRLNRTGPLQAAKGKWLRRRGSKKSDAVAEMGPRADAAGLCTASLDEVLCITAV